MHLTKQSDKESEKLTESPHFDHNDNHWRYEQLNKINNIYREIRFPYSKLHVHACIDILFHDVSA